MKISKCIQLLFILGVAHYSSAQALEQEVVNLPAGGNKSLTGKNIFLFEDTSNQLTFNQVQSQKFFESGSGIPNFGYSSSTIWVKIKVNNAAGSGHWGIVIESPNLNEVQLYDSDQSSTLPVFTSLRYTKEYINHYFPISEGQHEFYLRIKSDGLLFLPIKIGEGNHLLEARHRMDIWQGLYFGFMLSAILFNLFIYISLRDVTYLYYSVYNIFITFFIAYDTGYLGHALGNAIRSFDKYSVLTSLTSIFGLLFIIKFLKAGLSRRLISLGKWVIYPFFIALTFEFVGLTQLANIIAGIASFAGSIYTLFISTHAIVVQRFKPAKFFLIAWLVLLVSALIYNFIAFSIIPYNTFLFHSMRIGNVIETILISLALADRVAIIKKDIVLARQREHEYIYKQNLLISKQNARLHEAIEARTRELEKANSVKDRFFSIVAHDIRNPLHSLSALLNLFQSEISSKFSRQQIISLTQKLGAAVRNTIDLTENLLTWAKSQMELNEMISEEVDLSEVVMLTVNDLSTIANHKRIRIRDEIQPNVSVIADRQHLTFIIRNLLTNAIKFTEPGGEVNIKSISSDGYIHIQVMDNGVGIPRESLQNIFRLDVRKNMPGTKGEKGTGLGLPLCKEFVEKNKGAIYVKSELGLGSVFVVSLPDAELKNSPTPRKKPVIINEFSFLRR